MSSGDFEVGHAHQAEPAPADQAQTLGEDDAPRVRFLGGTPPPVAGAFHEPGVSASDLAFGEQGCQLCNVPPQPQPAPVAGHLTSHQDPHAVKLPPDEQPVDWMQYAEVTAPPDPFVLRDIIPAETPPAPPDTVVQWHDPSELYGHGEAPSPNPLDSGKIHVDAFHMDQRLAWWDAYRAVATQVDGMQRDVAPDVDLFRHAERNPELRALGFILDRKDWQGNLGSLAEDQQVPQRGGPRVGSLFFGSDLALSGPDDRAIASAGEAMQHGRGGVEHAFLETERADTDLKDAIEDIKSAAINVSETKHGIDAAVADLDAAAAAREASEARVDIAALRREADVVAGTLSFAFGLPEQLTTILDGGATGTDALGTTANTILGLVSDERLHDAQTRLAEATRRMQDAAEKGLEARLAHAWDESRKAVHKLQGSRNKLLGKLTERREAYNAAGLAAAEVSSGPDASKHKVAAIISAIPIVEAVVAAIRNIVDKTTNAAPTYTREAALGYGIARYHQTEESLELPIAIGQLLYIQRMWGMSLANWKQRLDTLLAAKDRIAGPRPQSQEG